jgi:hypothetical protein
MPVSVAGGERSFSKQELIKTYSYLRSHMSEERLSSLATFSIESAIAQNPDFSELVKGFVDPKERKGNFH